MAQSVEGLQLSSVINAFAIVERVAETDAIGVTELANDLDMPKSTAHSYLKTLTDAGYLTKDGGKYRISLEVMRLGLVARQSEIFEEATTKISRLDTEFVRCANLGIPERGQLYVVRVTNTANAGNEGVTSHWHATGLGKAILARMSEDRVSRIIGQHGLPRLTENTITDRGELLDELEAIRDQGYAVDTGECARKTRCIAVPITDSDGQPLAAISVSGHPRPIRQAENKGGIIQNLISTGKEIETQLGYS